MTTERRGPKPERVSPLELRLYVAALLAAVYTISWRAIDGPPPATEPTIAAGAPPQRFVWIDRIPPAMRPSVALPAGWQRASEPRVVRAPAPRVPGVRTRSS